MHGIGANLENREWGPSPLSFFVVCPNPIHRVMVNWDPPFPLLYTCLWYGTIQNCITYTTKYIYITGTVAVEVYVFWKSMSISQEIN